MNSIPTLIEPKFKNVVYYSLKQCTKTKNKYKNLIFNASMFLFLLLLVGGILYTKYKGKLTEEQKKEKREKEKVYIFTKLKTMELIKKRSNNELITELPLFE